MSTFSVMQIETEIINILTAGSLDPNLVWLRGQPPKGRQPDYPFGFVEWSFGDRIPKLADQAEVLDLFSITWVSRIHDEDEAEIEALSKLKGIEDLIKAKPTLNDTVNAAWVSRRIKDKAFDRTDYSIIAVRLELKTRRKEIN